MSLRQTNELRHEADALKKAIVSMAQRPGEMTPVEVQQMDRWRKRLYKVLTKLGEPFSASEERMALPEHPSGSGSPSPQLANPQSYKDSVEDQGANVAMRIDYS